MEKSLPWYTLKVSSGQEVYVKNWLMREREKYNLEDYFLNAVSPCEKKYVIRNGKKVSKELLVYSGYVFINAEINEDVVNFLKLAPKSWGLVGQRGCGFSVKPVQLKKEEVDEILKLVDNLELGIASVDDEIDFVVGENVKIIDGPFVDFVGVIHGVYSDCKKLNVMINVFSRPTPVELSFSQVTKS